MSNLIKNYLQHILDIIGSNKSYDDICDLYNLHEKGYLDGKGKVTVLALKKAHTGADRGNLPSGMMPYDFYNRIVKEIYPNEKKLKDFARRLHQDLTRSNIFPSEWEKQENFISGFSDEFDAEIFASYFIDLLKKDKDAKKNKPDPTQTQELSPFVFSSKFFNEGAFGIVDFNDDEFENELRRLSDVFKNITSIEFKHESTAFENNENWIVSLKNWIKLCLNQTDNKDILKIKGPLGSYKNRLMQYLYLAIERDLDFIAPIYIDIASYEKAAEGTEGIDEKKFLEAFERDIKEAEEIVSKAPDKKHLLLLDGIRDFSCRNESLYYSINERIKSKDWYFIVCMDTDFTFNKKNKYEVHPLVSNNFECYLRLRSMNLNRKSESIDFIRNCVNVFNIKIPDTVSIEQIYNNLVRLDFLNIDAYWLKYLLQTHIHVINNSKTNISGLYNAISINFLGSYDSIDTAAQFAFEFEFESNHIDTNPRFDLGWRLMKEHRSMFDFLIAKHYVKKVLSFDLKSGSGNHKNRFEIFNMVIQNNIGRFAFAMLAGNEDYEHLIMQLATHHYDDFKPIGKSELAFRITGLKNIRRRQEGILFIRLFLEKELEHFKNLSSDDIAKKKDYAFLLRSLYINLIYNNDREAFVDYFKMLLSDKMANSINRGFHLEYFGDKFFIPNKSLLDFEDDVRKGYNTFNKLCLVLDTRIRNNDKAVYAAAIEITTLCHLIQARIEQNQASKVFDVTPYIDDCLRYLKWIVDRPQIKEFDNIVMYFNWVANEFKNLAENSLSDTKSGVKYYHATPFNDFSIAKSIGRAGWLKKEIPNPENVVEHMYNCWLMGMLYLPETYYVSGYCKNTVLQILLIHDLVEAKTGNIDHMDKEEYECHENFAMRSLLLSGTYPAAVDLNTYMEYWETWNKKRGINYLIAKDIDNIQTIYQFCGYYLKYPDLFSDEDIAYWLTGLDKIETDICKEIVDTLILRNPLFSKLLEHYNSDDEN